jgi:hypothetical protein
VQFVCLPGCAKVYEKPGWPSWDGPFSKRDEEKEQPRCGPALHPPMACPAVSYPCLTAVCSATVPAVHTRAVTFSNPLRCMSADSSSGCRNFATEDGRYV